MAITTFDGGAGEFTLNFEGLKEGRHTVKIDVGVGEVRIELPRGFPVRVEGGDGWFKSVKLIDTDFERTDDNVYETADYKKSENRLDITLDVGIGEIKIIQLD